MNPELVKKHFKVIKDFRIKQGKWYLDLIEEYERRFPELMIDLKFDIEVSIKDIIDITTEYQKFISEEITEFDLLNYMVSKMDIFSKYDTYKGLGLMEIKVCIQELIKAFEMEINDTGVDLAVSGLAFTSFDKVIKEFNKQLNIKTMNSIAEAIGMDSDELSEYVKKARDED